MKRLSKFIALFVTMMLFLSAVQVFAGGAAQQAGRATPIDFWLFNEFHQRYFEAGVRDWNQRFPNRQVDVTFDMLPHQELANKLLIAFQSGTGAPDIADININNFSVFMQGRIQLAPLDRIVNPVRSQFVQSRFDIYSRNGIVYGLPTHVGATVVYYNRALASRAGIDVDNIRTWAQFEDAGRAYVAATGRAWTAIETSNQRPFWPMIVQRGGDYLDRNGNVVLDSQVNIDVLRQLDRWMNVDRIATALPGGSTATEETFAFINQGNIVALIMPMWYMSRYLNFMPDLHGDIVIRPMPVSGPNDFRSAGIGGTGTSVTTQSRNVDLSVDLLGHIKLTPEANIRIWEHAQFDPPRWDVWNSPQLARPLPYFGNEVVFNTLLGFRDSIPSPNPGDLLVAAQDIVMSSVMFRALVQRHDPAVVLREAAAELRARR